MAEITDSHIVVAPEATKSCESKLAAKSIEDDAMTIPVEVDTSLVKVKVTLAVT